MWWIAKIMTFANLAVRPTQLASQRWLLTAILSFCFWIVKSEDVSAEVMAAPTPQGHSPDPMCPLQLEEESCLFQSGLCQALRWSHSKLINWLSDRPILPWEFYHCNCRQMLAMFLGTGILWPLSRWLLCHFWKQPATSGWRTLVCCLKFSNQIIFSWRFR